MNLEKETQLISGAIDKAFKSGVYGVQEASQILACLGALQSFHYSKQTIEGATAANMEVIADEVKPEEPKPANKKK